MAGVWGFLTMLLGGAVFLASSGDNATPVNLDQGEVMSFTLTSSAFSKNGDIPINHTCDGPDVSPPLAWSDVPEDTVSFALVMDDPDASNFTHWVLFNLPGDLRELSEGVPRQDQLQNGALQGRGFGGNYYGGPCPPSGSHTYRFFLYALGQALDLGPGISKQEVLSAIEGHILGQAQLNGRYSRQR